MQYTVLKSKIHHATVTHSSLHYEGSITIDQNLLKHSNIIQYEKVLISNMHRGTRFETYVIAGKSDSGVIQLNGATARLGKVGDRLTIMSFTELPEKEAVRHKPKVIVLEKQNKIKKSV